MEMSIRFPGLGLVFDYVPRSFQIFGMEFTIYGVLIAVGALLGMGLVDRVVLKQSVAEETTKSGIVLPGQAKEKPQYAEVIEVGPGAVVDGKLVPMDVKVGDTVIYQKFAGSELNDR